MDNSGISPKQLEFLLTYDQKQKLYFLELRFQVQGEFLRFPNEQGSSGKKSLFRGQVFQKWEVLGFF
ncbi:MAG: hypothetical protein MOGMAGMI_00345 [Candidatus Omnitrophica bacterium]|nr:hypothetical protein [Candidatus Omnitrophota bacterium]